MTGIGIDLHRQGGYGSAVSHRSDSRRVDRGEEPFLKRADMGKRGLIVKVADKRLLGKQRRLFQVTADPDADDQRRTGLSAGGGRYR